MKRLIFRLLITAMMMHTVSASTAQEIGLQLYSLRNQFAKDVPGTLKQVQKFGIRQVELAGTYGLNNKAFKEMLDGHQLEVISVGADFDLLDRNPQEAVDFAKAFGAKYVTCFWIPHEGDDFTLADIEKAIKVFNTAGKLLKENGIELCYHPHGYEFRPYKDGTLFDHLVKSLNPQYANFEMDVFWIKHPGQDPVALLKKYPNRFPLMHLKDRKPGTAGNQFGRADVESNVVLGSGDVGIAEIMKIAPQYGVKYYFIEDESSRSEQQIPESLKFLRGISTKNQ